MFNNNHKQMGKGPIDDYSKIRIFQGSYLYLLYYCTSVYLMMKGSRIVYVIDSRSLEVNILANVSAVVSPAGLFL